MIEEEHYGRERKRAGTCCLPGMSCRWDFSMWIQTKAAKTAKAGQFISMYTNDGSKLLPRPISICEIDREGGKLRVVYRVTGEKTGTEQFSKMKAGDTIPVIGPLGNGFPLIEKKAFLIGEGNRSTSDSGTCKITEL